MKIPKDKEKIEPVYGCSSCEITSETPPRMCPCPRGGCEAVMIATKKISVVYTPVKKENNNK